MTLGIVILALVTLQRLGELWLSNRNTRRLLARGAQEVGAKQYPLIVAVHVLWLATLWWLAPGRPAEGFWLALYVLLQIARFWVIASLRDRWTTRIIVLPDAPLVRHGPYRFVAHPNYAVVVAEIAVLPLVFGLWWISVLFSLLNAAVLTIRIREEDRALGRA
ncbi:isoprenylcysteine carboxyl methyltransferase family protein [Sphingomonas sp. URHD0057]|uniref:isoprenylcysteine carboxyl methyltransferase family protein n=1 Tax=Sphingomonas sp. URHD0057 TaxID=1380389 RepID=UPI00048F315D|nr:isoprenylcysteine carboxylmethyltransferase family protein [Sphingomonas sp. URHD0057]